MYANSPMVVRIKALPPGAIYTELKRAANDRSVAGREAFMAAKNLDRMTADYLEQYNKPTRTADDSMLRYLSDKVVCALIQFILSEENKTIAKVALDSQAEAFINVRNASNESQPALPLQDRVYAFFGYDVEPADPITPELKRKVATIINDRINDETADANPAATYSELIGVTHILLSDIFNPATAATAMAWEFPELKLDTRDAALQFLERIDVKMPNQMALGSVKTGSFSMHPQLVTYAPMNRGTQVSRMEGVASSLTARPPARSVFTALNRLTGSAGGSSGPVSAVNRARLTGARPPTRDRSRSRGPGGSGGGGGGSQGGGRRTRNKRRTVKRQQKKRKTLKTRR